MNFILAEKYCSAWITFMQE